MVVVVVLLVFVANQKTDGNAILRTGHTEIQIVKMEKSSSSRRAASRPPTPDS